MKGEREKENLGPTGGNGPPFWGCKCVCVCVFGEGGQMEAGPCPLGKEETGCEL